MVRYLTFKVLCSVNGRIALAQMTSCSTTEFYIPELDTQCVTWTMFHAMDTAV